MDELQLWNPSLLFDCSNLLLDEAYCVSGDANAAKKRAAGAMATAVVGYGMAGPS